MPDAGDAVRAVITGDGRELARQDLRYGATAPLDIAPTGVLRLTITVTALSGDESSPRLALGDVLPYGSLDTIAGLDR